MSLIVEDGTGLANAESLISVADATAYHAARGNAAWAALASDIIREQLLRKATDYMGQVYRMSWAGYRKTTAQALDWPRYEVPIIDSPAFGLAYYDENSVPTIVKNACAELALRAASDDLAPDLEQRIKREKIDVIETEYDSTSPQYVRYRAIDNMLAPFFGMASNGSFRKLVRT